MSSGRQNQPQLRATQLDNAVSTRILLPLIFSVIISNRLRGSPSWWITLSKHLLWSTYITVARWCIKKSKMLSPQFFPSSLPSVSAHRSPHLRGLLLIIIKYITLPLTIHLMGYSGCSAGLYDYCLSLPVKWKRHVPGVLFLPDCQHWDLYLTHSRHQHILLNDPLNSCPWKVYKSFEGGSVFPQDVWA